MVNKHQANGCFSFCAPSPTDKDLLLQDIAEIRRYVRYMFMAIGFRGLESLPYKML
jgi:hypothetical protein